MLFSGSITDLILTRCHLILVFNLGHDIGNLFLHYQFMILKKQLLARA